MFLWLSKQTKCNKGCWISAPSCPWMHSKHPGAVRTTSQTMTSLATWEKKIFQWRKYEGSVKFFLGGPQKKQQHKHTRWCFQRCFIFIPTLGEGWTHFDFRIFFKWVGWNHQPGNNFSWIELCQISHLEEKTHKHVHHISLRQFPQSQPVNYRKVGWFVSNFGKNLLIFVHKIRSDSGSRNAKNIRNDSHPRERKTTRRQGWCCFFSGSKMKS